MRDSTSPLFDKLLAWAIGHQLHPVIRYSLASFAILATAALRALFTTTLLPWLLFVPVVVCLALALGLRTGIYATLLAALCACVSIAPDEASFLLERQQWIAALLFILINLGLSFLASEIRAAFRRNQRLLRQREQAAEIIAAHESELSLLNGELGHRLKNQLTIVQAIVGQIIRRSPTLDFAEKAVSDRLAALGRATDLLSMNGTATIDFRSVAEAVLAPHRSHPERLVCKGPAVQLSRDAALALSLVLHELATNALKYGALSNDSGRVELGWSTRADPDQPDKSRFALEWRETGGPPVREPVRQGFGTALIQRSLQPHFDGRVATIFEPAGLRFQIDASLPALHADRDPPQG